MKIPRLLLVATASTLLGAVSLLATETDARIESAAKASHVFKTYLKDDTIGTVSRNGAVVLTGTGADAAHRALAEHTVENLPGVTRLDHQLPWSERHCPSIPMAGWRRRSRRRSCFTAT